MSTYLPSVPNASRIATAITLLFTVTFCFGEVRTAHGQTTSFPINRTDGTSNIRRIPMPKKHLPANPNLDQLKVRVSWKVLCLFENGRDNPKERISVFRFDHDWLMSDDLNQ